MARDRVDVRLVFKGERRAETVELPDWPRVGDEIEWADSGRNVRVVSFAWLVGDDRPIAVVE